MAKLPTAADIRRVQPVSIPEVRYPVEAFTAGARALQKAGDELILLGEQQAEEDAAAEARKADAELQKRLREQRNGTVGDPSTGGTELDAGLAPQSRPGWAMREGLGLVNSQGEIGEQIDSVYQEILEGLSPRARKKFEPIGFRRINSEHERLANAVGGARKQWQADASQARVDELQQAFIEGGSEEDKVALMDEIRRTTMFSIGVSSFDEITDEQTRQQAQSILTSKMREALTVVHKERINQLLVDDPNGYQAERYFNENKDEISADEYDSISRVIETANFKRDTAKEATNLIANFGAGAIAKAKQLADSKGQEYADAVLTRVKSEMAERKAQAAAANAQTVNAIDSFVLEGNTIREAMDKFPGYSGWNNPKVIARLEKLYETGRERAYGGPFVMTLGAKAYERELMAMTQEELSQVPLPNVYSLFPSEKAEKWEDKIYAAGKEFSWGNQKHSEDAQKHIMAIVNESPDLIPGYVKDKSASAVEKANNVLLARGKLNRLIKDYGLKPGVTRDNMLVALVNAQKSAKSPNWWKGDLGDLSNTTGQERRDFADNNTDLAVNEGKAALVMTNATAKANALKAAQLVHKKAVQNFKEARVELPDGMSPKMPELNDTQLYKIAVWTEMHRLGGGGDEQQEAEYQTALLRNIAKVMGAYYAPTEGQISAQNDAARQAQQDAQNKVEQQKQEAARRQRKENVAAFALLSGTNSVPRLGLRQQGEQAAQQIQITAPFEEIPSEWQWSTTKANLLHYHRAVLSHSAHKVNADGTFTTALTVGVQGPVANVDAMDPPANVKWIYEVPSYINGRILKSEKEIAKHAQKVGWQHFPRWRFVDGKPPQDYKKYQKQMQQMKEDDMKKVRVGK